MATGDSTDMLGRLKALLPRGWFGDTTPILDALLSGFAYTLSFVYSLIAYAKLQTRIATATDGFLDLISFDFFGANLPRRNQELDAPFRTRILSTLLREKGTRKGMIEALVALTGRAPIIFEPARPADTGGWNIGWGWNIAGGFGSSPANRTFTYTAGSAGTKTISFTNTGGLTNPTNTSYAASVGATFAADNAAFVYSPSNWLVSGGQAKTINGGAYGAITFTGAVCSLNFNVNASTPYPEVIALVDNRVVYSGPVNQSPIVLTMPADTTTWPHHRLELRVKAISGELDRWNTQAAALVFTGITIANGAAVVAPTVSPNSILVIGDSITEGEWTLQYPGTYTPGDDATYYDGSLGWAYLLRQFLGVEVGVIGFGKQGFNVQGVGNVPVVTSSYGSLWSGQARTFGSPNAILINEGTNDVSGNGSSPANCQAGIESLLTSLLSATPSTTKIIVMRPFSGNGWSYLEAGVAAINSPRVSLMDTTGFFNTAESGDGIHPLGSANLNTIGPMVAAAAQPIIFPAGVANRWTHS